MSLKVKTLPIVSLVLLLMVIKWTSPGFFSRASITYVYTKQVLYEINQDDIVISWFEYDIQCNY